MRVILEPTSTMVDLQYRVEIESPSDELTIWDLMELLKAAVLAYGYHWKPVNDIFDPDSDADSDGG